MAEYFGVILAFAAVLFSIFGDTWDNTKTGIKKLLPVGRIVLTLAVLTLLFNLYQINESRKESEKLRQAAISSLKTPVRKLFTPLEKLLLRSKKTYNGKNAYLVMGDNQKDTFFYYLNNKSFFSVVDTIKIWEKPFYDDTTATWLTYFQKYNEEAHSSLTNILAMYSNYLDVETVLAINNVLNDDNLNSILNYKLNKVRKNASDLERMHFNESDIADLLNFYYPTEQYNEYLTNLETLYDKYKSETDKR